MESNIRRNFLIYVLTLSFIMISCSYEDSNPISCNGDKINKNIWINDNSVQFSEKYITSLLCAGGDVYFVTPDKFIKYDNGRGEAWFHRLPSSYVLFDQYKHGIFSDCFIVSYDQSTIQIKHTEWGFVGGGSVYIPIEEIDSTLTSIGKSGFVSPDNKRFITSATYGDSAGVLLFSINCDIDSLLYEVNSPTHFSMVSKRIGISADSLITFSSFKLVPNYALTLPPILYVTQDNFIAGMAGETFLIDVKGDVTPLFHGEIGELLEVGDSFVSFASVYTDSTQWESKFLRSNDDGATWESMSSEGNGTLLPPDNNMAANVNGIPIFYRNDQLWRVERTVSGYSIRELDNSGIEGNQISGVTFYDDKVIVTTLSGLFYTSWMNFSEL